MSDEQSAAIIQDELSKLDIIEHHIITSIQLIAIEASPVSIHVIAMACEEMILSLANARGVSLEFDYRIYVKDEHHKQYRDHIKRPYNFFKHANKDPHDNYSGPSLDDLSNVNETLTLMNCIGYRELGGAKDIFGRNFAAIMLARNPRLFKVDFLSDKPELKKGYEELRKGPDYTLPALRQILFEGGLLPSIPHASRY